MSGRQESVNNAAPPMAAPALSHALDLSRKRRLTPAGYRETFDTNNTWAGRYFVMWLQRVAESQGQLGTVATKRILPRAVDRNRARRLLRETYRLNRPNLVTDANMILLARRPIRGVKLGDVVRDFQRIARQARIWRDQT